MSDKKPFVILTDSQSGMEVRFAKGAILGVDDNGDGTSTVHILQQGAHKVNESADWIEDALKKLT